MNGFIFNGPWFALYMCCFPRHNTDLLLLNKIEFLLDHPGRVTLKTSKFFVVFCFSSTIREGDP